MPDTQTQKQKNPRFPIKMGVVSMVLGVFGFGIGVSIGLVSGYYFFIYFQSSNVYFSIGLVGVSIGLGFGIGVSIGL
jgi:hypothetical protein